MSHVMAKNEKDLSFTLRDSIVLFFKRLTLAVTLDSVKQCVEHVKALFNINALESAMKMDFIRIDYPEGGVLYASPKSTFCFPIIYTVMKNSDTCEGRGPMVPHAHFLNMFEAINYMHGLSGVQGMKENVFEDRFGSYDIEISIVHESAQSAHTCNEVAQALLSAKADLKRAMERFNSRRDVLVSHHMDTSDLCEPRLEQYVRDTKRKFLDG